MTNLPLSGAIPGPKEKQRKCKISTNDVRHLTKLIKQYLQWPPWLDRDFTVLERETNQLLFLADDEDFGDEYMFDEQLFKLYIDAL